MGKELTQLHGVRMGQSGLRYFRHPVRDPLYHLVLVVEQLIFQSQVRIYQNIASQKGQKPGLAIQLHPPVDQELHRCAVRPIPGDLFLILTDAAVILQIDLNPDPDGLLLLFRLTDYAGTGGCRLHGPGGGRGNTNTLLPPRATPAPGHQTP